MSHVCAKPACTQKVQVWLDFAPASRQVVEQRTRTEVSVGLCETHADRFTVPEGWSLDLLPLSPADNTPAPDNVSVDGRPEKVSAPANRARRPWFLALSDVVIDEGAHDGLVDVETPSAEVESDEAIDEPSAGSLLHRAFHGPDRTSDRSRAARDQLDELEPRRAAKTPREARDNGMAELPFPPFEPEHRVAVS
jgi:hypothetical protein